MLDTPLSFPDALPKDEPVVLWSLQQRLLAEAEQRFGKRDDAKTIYQPIFRDDGPIIINTPDLDGAFAALSNNAAGYWPTAVYELAHETVHLLNPRTGSTNWLEEGLAVAFSVEMSARLTHHPMAPPENSKYALAHNMVASLPVPYNEIGMLVRSVFGELRSAQAIEMKQLFPNAETDVLDRLTETCKLR